VVEASQLDPSVRDMVARSPLVCFVLEITSGVIIAASPRAESLLADGDGEVIGRSIEDFLVGEPAQGANELLVAGKLLAYETVRGVRRGDHHVEFHGWVQALRDSVPPRYALAVAWQKESGNATGLPGVSTQLPPVVGTIDGDLHIERISADVESVFGYNPDALIGQPLLRLVEQRDVANILLALGHAAASGNGAIHRARIRAVDGSLELCSVLVLPLVPLPSAAFALLPGDHVEQDGALFSGQAVQLIIERLGRTIDAATVSRQLADAPWGTSSRLNRLSTRELEIVRRLAAGDRVPTIAESLYVAQSTIRNQLSAVFRKLGVHSQQELIDLLREMSVSSPDE
jgi:DNA-binding CsgD family transcriptional regulator/PAS domain-containing protein